MVKYKVVVSNPMNQGIVAKNLTRKQALKELKHQKTIRGNPKYNKVKVEKM